MIRVPSALRPVFAAHEAPACVVWRHALIVRLVWVRRVPYMSAHPASRTDTVRMHMLAAWVVGSTQCFDLQCIRVILV